MIKIVIADDHELFREGLRSLLTKQNRFEIVGEARDGKEAIHLARSVSPEIVIMDIEMPEMGGLEATSEILRHNPDIKILALSRHYEKKYVSEMFAAGAAGYILKDSAVEELIKAVDTVVDNEVYCSPSLVGVVVQGYKSLVDQEKNSVIGRLTEREKEILLLISTGKQLKEIAFELEISYKTVTFHRKHIMDKLKVFSDVELTKIAIREGLVSL